MHIFPFREAVGKTDLNVAVGSDKMGTHVRFLVTTSCYGACMDYDALSPADHTDVICQLAAMENAIKRERLAAMAAYDRKEAWKADSTTSMASWAVGMLGAGRDTAAEEVRVAHRFEELGHIAETFKEGLLSWDQARAVTRFATPETDKQLAAEARKFSAPQLRRMARRFEPVSRETAHDAIVGRAFNMWWDVEANMLRIKGQLPAAEGAVVEKAIDRATKQIAAERDERIMRLEQLRADALARVCSAAVASDPDADRATIGVHVDARVLAGEPGMAELDCGQSIAMETAKRLACDSRWYIVVDGPDGLPIGIGRTSRQIPAWLAREIRHRDGGCRWFGCGRRGWTSIHHLVEWIAGGPTDMDNLVLLCTVHHRMVHEGGWKIVGDPNGELAFVSPDGLVYAQGPHGQSRSPGDAHDPRPRAHDRDHPPRQHRLEMSEPDVYRGESDIHLPSE